MIDNEITIVTAFYDIGRKDIKILKEIMINIYLILNF